MTTEQVCDVLSRFARDFDVRRISALAISGGEPALRPDLADVIRHAVRLGFRVGLDSNGSILGRSPHLIDRLVEAGMTIPCFSVDGLEEEHDANRGAPGVPSRGGGHRVPGEAPSRPARADRDRGESSQPGRRAAHPRAAGVAGSAVRAVRHHPAPGAGPPGPGELPASPRTATPATLDRAQEGRRGGGQDPALRGVHLRRLVRPAPCIPMDSRDGCARAPSTARPASPWPPIYSDGRMGACMSLEDSLSVQGNLLEEDPGVIWARGFERYRNREALRRGPLPHLRGMAMVPGRLAAPPRRRGQPPGLHLANPEGNLARHGPLERQESRHAHPPP